MTDPHVIKLVNRQGQRAFVIDESNFSLGYTPDAKQFESYFVAQQFIRDHKLEKNGTRAYILDKARLLADLQLYSEASPIKKTMHYVENAAGEKLFYDVAKNTYYFSKGDLGYCVWHNKKDIAEFVDHLKLEGTFEIKDLIPDETNLKLMT